MARERELRVQIVGDASSAKKAFGEVERGGDQMAGKFDKWGKGATALFHGAIAAGAISAGKALIDHGAKLEQMQQKANIVFGEQIKIVDQWAKTNANAMGLTRREAVGLATNLADLLIPMGMSRDAAAEMSTRVVGLSGALSAWSGGTRSAAEVAEILTSAMLGERDALKGLGISIDAAEIEAALLAKGQSELTGQLRQQAEALATVELLFAKSTDAQTAFGDETQTTAEKIAEQNAKFRELKDTVSIGVTGALNSLAAWYLDSAVPALERFGASLVDNKWRMREFYDAWMWTFEGIGAAVVDFVATTQEQFRKVMDTLRRFFELLAKVPGPLGAAGDAGMDLLNNPAPVKNVTSGIAGALAGQSIVVNQTVQGNVISGAELADQTAAAIRVGTRQSALIGAT